MTGITKPSWLTSGRVVNALGVILLLIIVVPFVAHAVPSAVGATTSYVVQSGSMEPTLQTGSVIFVYETEPQAIEEGDIIVYDLSQSNRQVTTHRVTDVVRDDRVTFQTKGDANEDPDPYRVPAGDVIGTVPVITLNVPVLGTVTHAATVPYIGHALVFVGTKWGLLLIVIGPAALLIISESYALARAYRQTKSSESASQGEDTSPGDETVDESAIEPDSDTVRESEFQSEGAGGDLENVHLGEAWKFVQLDMEETDER